LLARIWAYFSFAVASRRTWQLRGESGAVLTAKTRRRRERI